MATGWRALEAGAQEVIGIDPSILFCLQHRAVQRFVRIRNWVLPLKGEELPTTAQFDLCLSMGVLYRRDPLQHVNQLYDLTRPGGRGTGNTDYARHRIPVPRTAIRTDGQCLVCAQY